MQILKMRLPTCDEWDTLVKAVHGDNAIIHWAGTYFWFQDRDPDWYSAHAICGNSSPHIKLYYDSSLRRDYFGFRPAFEVLNSEGTVATVGTLYMDGQPVRVRQGLRQVDITEYVPGARLELQEALEDPDYQVKAIKTGNIWIADRVLLQNISWDDIQEGLGIKTRSAALVVNGVKYSFDEISERLGVSGPIQSLEIQF